MTEKAVGPKLMEYLNGSFGRVPMRRLVRTDEIAAAFAFLASDDASAITGQNLTVDCGLTANWYILETLPEPAELRTTVAGWRAVTLAASGSRSSSCPSAARRSTRCATGQSGIDVLFHAPWGLQPPGAPPRDGSDGHGFLERYAGGWQELFPSANDPTTYRGAAIPFHGEVALLPWDVDAEGEELVCRVRCERTPFALERRMRLEGDALVLDETVINRSDDAAALHLGPPLRASGRRSSRPAAGSTPPWTRS